MNREELLSRWKAEEQAAVMSGWDFSHIAGRMEEGPLPWDYRGIIGNFLKPATRLLDMGTGGGEFLLSLGHDPRLTSVTEGWAPNLALCRQRLAPRGVTVAQYDSEKGEPLPFPDDSFDLVLNRHESYDLAEIRRVLRPGGFFLTQQVGASNNFQLSQFLGLSAHRPTDRSFNLENQAPKFRAAGFRVMECGQAYPEDRFFDVGALCWLMKVLPWEFPDFSVETCKEQLLKLQDCLEQRGFVGTGQHRFYVVAKQIRN